MAIADVEQLIKKIETDFSVPFDKAVNRVIRTVNEHFQKIHDDIVARAKKLKEDKDRLELELPGEVSVWQEKTENFGKEAHIKESMAGIRHTAPSEPSKPD